MSKDSRYLPYNSNNLDRMYAWKSFILQSSLFFEPVEHPCPNILYIRPIISHNI